MFNFSKRKDKNKQNTAFNSLKNAPKTAQQTIPYVAVFKNGIIETSPCHFSKSYPLCDVNFKTASNETQEQIFNHFEDLLNTLGVEATIQITIHNKSITNDSIKEKILLKTREDGLNEYRQEYNQMLLDKMQESMNNIQRDKYLTLSVEAENIDQANVIYGRLDEKVSDCIRAVSGVKDTVPLTIMQRLNILHNIYNPGYEDEIIVKQEEDGKVFCAADLKDYLNGKNSTKDLISPPGFVINDHYLQVGDSYCRTMFLKTLPSYMKLAMLTDMTELPCNMLTSVYYSNIQQDKAIKLVRGHMININSNVVEAQKRASKSGYSPDLISPELLGAQKEAKEIMSDISERDQNLFYVTMVVTIFAQNMEDLEKFSKMVQSIGNRYLCQFKELMMQQEQGLNTALPLCYNQLYVKRLNSTESACSFMPFSAQDLVQKNGMYYGLNPISKNLILYNRSSANNANGLILGKPGSGKSFSAKREIMNVALGTQDQIYIVDPEEEYVEMTRMLNGTVIRIAAGASSYLNPFDMDLKFADDDDPISLKSDYIVSLCETVVGGRFGLDPIQISIIDRCVRQLYREYLNYMHKERPGITIDKQKSPTFRSFYELLIAQPEPEAKYLATSIEIYAKGSLDTFSHTTNVQTDNRIVCYDIKDIGSSMKEMGLHVCLNEIWNQAIRNKSMGIRTWFYMDEFHLLLANESSAKFIKEIYKRARKWNAIPTGITQNVGDLLESPISQAIIDNSEFIYMLDQSPNDKMRLANQLHISENQMEYISSGGHGQGLIYTGSSIVPFIDNFPQDTKLYKVMTSKPDETLRLQKEEESAARLKKMMTDASKSIAEEQNQKVPESKKENHIGTVGNRNTVFRGRII